MDWMLARLFLLSSAGVLGVRCVCKEPPEPQPDLTRISPPKTTYTLGDVVVFRCSKAVPGEWGYVAVRCAAQDGGGGEWGPPDRTCDAGAPLDGGSAAGVAVAVFTLAVTVTFIAAGLRTPVPTVSVSVAPAETSS